jgi:hypothetical protein
VRELSLSMAGTMMKVLGEPMPERKLSVLPF